MKQLLSIISIVTMIGFAFSGNASVGMVKSTLNKGVTNSVLDIVISSDEEVYGLQFDINFNDSEMNFVEGESLLISLRDVAISTGSACNSANPSPSHVLSAMGLSRQEAYDSLRISIGRFTTEEEINHAISHITEQVEKLRAMSPVWQKVKDQLSD